MTMSEKDKTFPRVFIIESLDFEDETNKHFEGEIISKILNFSNIQHQYHYVRTKVEFEHFIKEFNKSNYRYLHISCHGNTREIATTLDSISFDDLIFILQNVLDRKRLFISACSSTNKSLANKIFPLTDCYSIIGPAKDINMDDAAIFWASFYQIMFKKNNRAMKRNILLPTLRQLSKLHEMPMKYYSSSKASAAGWKVESIRG